MNDGLGLAASIGCAIVALQHVGFMVLEMFLWTKPAGMKIFRTDPAFAARSRALAANQGLYNGFLAAGLFAALFHPDSTTALFTARLFLIFVAIAGAFGAATVSRRILWMQAFPATVVLALLFFRS